MTRMSSKYAKGGEKVSHAVNARNNSRILMVISSHYPSHG